MIRKKPLFFDGSDLETSAPATRRMDDSSTRKTEPSLPVTEPSPPITECEPSSKGIYSYKNPQSGDLIDQIGEIKKATSGCLDGGPPAKNISGKHKIFILKDQVGRNFPIETQKRIEKLIQVAKRVIRSMGQNPGKSRIGFFIAYRELKDAESSLPDLELLLHKDF